MGSHQNIHFFQALRFELDQAYRHDFDVNQDHYDDAVDRLQDKFAGDGFYPCHYVYPDQDGNDALKFVDLKDDCGRARRRTWDGLAQYGIQRVPLLWNAVLREDQGRQLYDRTGRQSQGRPSRGRQAMLR